MKALFATIALLLLGCSGTLQQDLNTALVFEGNAQAVEQQIVVMAQAAIATLPVATQATAQAALTDASNKVTLAFQAKDAALQAAIDADNANGLNLNQLLSDITAAIQAIVALADSFGANQQQTHALAATVFVRARAK